MFSLGNADFIRLNGPFNLKNITGITFRFADAAAGRVAGSRSAAIVVRTGSQTGPIVTTFALTASGMVATADLEEPVVPALTRGSERAVPDVREVAAARRVTT